MRSGRPPHPVRQLPAVLVAASLLLVPGCGGSGEEFHDRSARVTVAGSTATFVIDSCGLDGETLYVLGRSGEGRILQLVVGVEDGTGEAGERRAGIPASTGLTVDEPDRVLTAFGAEAWSRAGRRGPVQGVISSARLHGSRIQVEGSAAVATAEGEVDAAADLVPVRADIRCDDPEG